MSVSTEWLLWTPALEVVMYMLQFFKTVSILILYAPTGLLCGKSQAKYTTKFSIYLILF